MEDVYKRQGYGIAVFLLVHDIHIKQEPVAVHAVLAQCQQVRVARLWRDVYKRQS